MKPFRSLVSLWLKKSGSCALMDSAMTFSRWSCWVLNVQCHSWSWNWLVEMVYIVFVSLPWFVSMMHNEVQSCISKLAGYGKFVVDPQYFPTSLHILHYPRNAFSKQEFDTDVRWENQRLCGSNLYELLPGAVRNGKMQPGDVQRAASVEFFFRDMDLYNFHEFPVHVGTVASHDIFLCSASVSWGNMRTNWNERVGLVWDAKCNSSHL